MARLACSWGKRLCDYCFKPTNTYTGDGNGWRICDKCKQKQDRDKRTETD